MSGADKIKQFLKFAPSGPGVYRMLGDEHEILYIGKARNLKKRLISYTNLENLPARLQRMVVATVKVEIVSTKTEAEALLLEANLIKHHQPRYNIDLKDDKSFPYIAIDDNHPYPRIYKHRGERERGITYFGPFASTGDVNKAIAVLQKSFLIRPCPDTVFSGRTRPCLEYQIKRCSAPCVSKISRQDYEVLVEQALQFLSGESRAVQQHLEKQMLSASKNREYEKAASFRDRIKALTQIQSTQHISTSSVTNADVIAISQSGGKACIQIFFFRVGQSLGNKAYFPARVEGYSPEKIIEAFMGRFYQANPAPKELILNIKPAGLKIIEQALTDLHNHKVKIVVPQKGKKLQLVKLAEDNARQALERKLSEDASTQEILSRLAEVFNLDEAPNRIEVFDNSHVSGSSPVGAMVVADPEGFRRNSYRKFNIKDKNTVAGDDYAMMREVLLRRYGRLKKESEEGQSNWPDLVLIDGGPGHFSVAREVFDELGLSNLKFICVAKGPDRNAGRERFYLSVKDYIQLPENDKLLFYLQRLRDEAHRFAITTHRAKRSKDFVRSPLDYVQGIGRKRKKALLHYFGSAGAVARASAEDIAKVEGISKKLAQQIYDQLNSN